MTGIANLLDPADDRVATLRGGEVGAAGPVLLWVQRAQRASGNHAANVAVGLANLLSRPVVAAFALAPAYPRATLRAYRFMAEGLAELPDGFAARGIGWTLRSGDPPEVIASLVSELGACAVVTDVAPTEPGRGWKATLAARVAVPVVAVDADVVVPSRHFPSLEWAPRTIRPKIGRLVDRYLGTIPDPVVTVRSDVREAPDPLALVDRLALDTGVGSAPDLRGGQAAARARFRRFCDTHLATYDVDRNRAEIDGSSRMSPYLHYGQIAPVELAVTALEAMRGRGHEAAVQAFLDELIVQRELAINFTLHQPGYDTYDALPDWGKQTLAKHAPDPRPRLYTRVELAEARTHDRVWNACQLQMNNEGYLPNRLRMYWGKQVPLWTATPEEAFATLVELNDRLFLDGRDPAGYAGIAWCVGGRHDRAFGPERPVTGLVRPFGIGALKRTMDVEAYVRGIEARWGPPRTGRLF